MIKRNLIKYIAMLICMFLLFSLFACVAQPIDGEGNEVGLTDSADSITQEVVSDSSVESKEVSEEDGEHKTEPDSNTENSDSKTDTETETETETETQKESNNGMGYVPL